MGESEKLARLRLRYATAETFTFGDTPALCAHLLSLVRSGRKTATCGALREMEQNGEAMPRVGRHDIALTWDGVPALVIRTTQVAQVRFGDVREDFALAEGENDDLAGWKRDHKAYFERNGGWSADMVLVCEHFVLAEDLKERIDV